MLGVLTRKRATWSPIGIDIGHTAVRAVQLRRRSGAAHGAAARLSPAYDVVDAVEWPLPAADGALAAAREKLARGLRQRGFHGRVAAAALSPPDIEVHALELPPPVASERKALLAAAARIEIARLMSFDEGAAECDYWRVPCGRGTPITALGVAARRERVLEVWDLCQAAGLDCRTIDASTCALGRLGATLQLAPRGQVWSVLDLGEVSSRLTLCVGATPVLAREIDVGGRAWTERIAGGLHISHAAAELHKCDHGIALRGRGVRAGETGGPGRRGDQGGDGTPREGAAPSAHLAGMIAAILHNDLRQLCSEIERSYAYVLQCFPDQAAGTLLLVGGGALTRNLDLYLAAELGIRVCGLETFVANGDGPLHWPRCAPRRASTFAIALGLALPEASA